MTFLICLIFLSFLNARDVEAIRDHFLAMIERAQQGLRILNRDQGPAEQVSPQRQNGTNIPEGLWKQDPASEKQLTILDKSGIYHKEGITKGEASDLIEDLFSRRDK